MKIRLLFLIAGIVLGAYMGGYLTSESVSSTYSYCTMIDAKAENASGQSYFATIEMPAVDQEGKGVTTSLDVQMVPGNGKTLTNVDKLFFWTDTQNSIRTAKSVAESITQKSLSNYDLVYTINANATVIEGPSAGAALTIATIAAIENKPLNKSVMITGTINPDGTIGQIGGVVEKATAAREIGAELFLVPTGQSSANVLSSERNCRKVGISQICSLQQVSHAVDVSQESGIEIKEVSSIEDALKYFLI